MYFADQSGVLNVNQIAAGLSWAPSLVGDRLDFKHW